MIRFKELVRPQSLQEAWELNQKKGNVVIAGMLWLKMQDRICQKAVDLSALPLDYITENEKEFRIGAMTTLRTLELDERLNVWFDHAFQKAFEPIVGVQFQSMATAGGSVAGRYGFSDVLTLLCALDARVVLFEKGEKKLIDFIWEKPDRDLVTEIIVPKTKGFTWCKAIRNQATDFPVLNCVIFLEEDTDTVRICFGARPGRTRMITADLKKQTVDEAAQRARSGIKTASNLRGSAEYRSRMIEILTKRGLDDLLEQKQNNEKEFPGYQEDCSGSKGKGEA